MYSKKLQMEIQSTISQLKMEIASMFNIIVNQLFNLLF